MRRLLLVGLLLCAGVFGGLPPSAANAQDLSKEEMKEFKQHVARGTNLYKKENYEKALSEFRAARQIVDHPNMIYRIGRSLQKLQRCKAAREAFEQYLDRENLEPDRRRKGEKRLAELEQCTPTGTLHVECDPASASVRVQDTMHSCPVDMELEAGNYRIRISADGYRTAEAEIELEGGAETNQIVQLSPTPTSTPTSDASGPKTSPPPADTGGEPVWPNYLRWTSLGAGVAAVGGGLFADSRAIQRNQALKKAERNGNWSRVRQLDRERQRGRVRTISLYATGGVLLASSITLFFIDFGSAESARSSTSPSARLSGGCEGRSVSIGVDW